jgi:hypothetical protein
LCLLASDEATATAVTAFLVVVDLDLALHPQVSLPMVVVPGHKPAGMWFESLAARRSMCSESHREWNRASVTSDPLPRDVISDFERGPGGDAAGRRGNSSSTTERDGGGNGGHNVRECGGQRV